MADEMKNRPKAGDLVEYGSYRSSQIGKIIAVAETGVYFLIEMPIGYKYRHKVIGLSAIIQILPRENSS